MKDQILYDNCIKALQKLGAEEATILSIGVTLQEPEKLREFVIPLMEMSLNGKTVTDEMILQRFENHLKAIIKHQSVN